MSRKSRAIRTQGTASNNPSPLMRDKLSQLRGVGKHTDEHKDLVASYVASGFAVRDFMEALATAIVGRSCRAKCKCPKESDDDGEEDIRSCWWRTVKRGLRASCRSVPDGYRIDAAKGLIEILEVDVTSHTTNAKLKSYGRLWWELDSFDEWSLSVIVVDRFGVARSFDGCGLGYADFPGGSIVATPARAS